MCVFMQVTEANKQGIWSATPCVAAHQLNNIKAAFHVKPAHFSLKLQSLANGSGSAGRSSYSKAGSELWSAGDTKHSFWWWWTDVLGDQKDR